MVFEFKGEQHAISSDEQIDPMFRQYLPARDPRGCGTSRLLDAAGDRGSPGAGADGGSVV
jgi:hypothetical protein